MRWLAPAALCLALSGCQNKQSQSLQVDSTLESLVPADTVTIIGANMDAIRQTPLYQRLIAQVPVPQIQALSRFTGIDPGKDLSRILFCSDGKNGLLLARGTFRQSDIEARLQSNGATESTFKSRRLFGNEQNAILFVNATTVAAGPSNTLRLLIDRSPSKRGIPATLSQLLRLLPANEQIYAAVISGPNGLELPLPKTEMTANAAQVLRSIANGAVGIDLSKGVDAIARINSSTERDAKFVHDMLKGFVGLGRLNTPPDRPELLKIYDAIQVTEQQSQTTVKADVPADQVTRLLDLWAAGSHSLN